MGSGLPLGSIHSLPVAAVASLARAQTQQDTARAIILRSAKSDTTGGKSGNSLNEILGDEDL